MVSTIRQLTWSNSDKRTTNQASEIESVNTSAFVRTYLDGVIVNSRADRDHDGDKDDRGDNASSTIGAP